MKLSMYGTHLVFRGSAEDGTGACASCVCAEEEGGEGLFIMILWNGVGESENNTCTRRMGREWWGGYIQGAYGEPGVFRVMMRGKREENSRLWGRS